MTNIILKNFREREFVFAFQDDDELYCKIVVPRGKHHLSVIGRPSIEPGYVIINQKNLKNLFKNPFIRFCFEKRDIAAFSLKNGKFLPHYFFRSRPLLLKRRTYRIYEDNKKIKKISTNIYKVRKT